ncbi:MAG: phospholipase D-like domain-containing protein, partial [Litorilinea sp.]
PPGVRRGYYLFTGAPPVVHALQRLFAHDYALQPFWDLLPYTADHVRYGAPPADYLPPPPPWYRVEAAPFAAPLTVAGPGRFVVVSAPEHALRPDDGLHALLQRAGAGDAIWVQQLYEHKHWGAGDSNAIADPNPRLQMVIEAARRGAQVRILLDGLFDDADALRSNAATAAYLHTLAAAEGLDIQVRVGNPTGGGIHAKLFLVRVGDEHWSAVGSLNGSEVSHKLNREVVLLTDVPGVFARLAEVFWWDWERVE